jgi:tetratricopeptide (TPR) repeat protein
VSRPADDPGQSLADTAGSPDAGQVADQGRQQRLAAEDLTWSEVADAVWLAAAIRPVPPPPEDEPEAPREEHRPAVSRAEPETAPPVPAPAVERAREPDPVPVPRPEPVPEPLRVVREPESHMLPGDGVGAAPGAGWSLPGVLKLMRALRPLKRYVPSRREGDVVIDEVATADRAVQDGLWWPVTRPRRERWLDLVLVIDGSPTMGLWRARVRAFVQLLEQLGTFRTVQVRTLDTNRSADGVALTPVLHGAGDTTPRDPAEVVDHSGRRVLLVITDGLGSAWRNDTVGPLLAQWGRAMPVSIVHLLPQWMWGRGGLALHRAKLTTATALRPNRRWSVELPDAWVAPDPATVLPDGAVPVPVLELGPRWLRWWARLVTGGHPAAADATVLLATDKPRPEVTAFGSDGEQSARQRVAAFRSVASPPAQRLAQLLAALPVSLPVAKLVQERFVPGSGPEVIVELITSGLLRYPSGTAPYGSTVDIRSFDITESDRETLLEGARRTETARVVRTAAHHLGHRIGALARLNDAIADPHTTPDPQAAADIELERVVMRALSGPYLSRAQRLAAPPDTPPVPVPRGEVQGPPVPVPVNSTESGSTMSKAAERAGIQYESAAMSTQSASETSGYVDSEPEPVTTPMMPTSFGTGLGKRHPGDAPPVWGNVPPRNLNFTGRDDLIEQLRKRLIAGGTTAVLPAALHGMGGIGKTQTAVEYIYRHLDDYDLIWWIQAAQPTQIRSGMTELAKQLRLPGSSEAHAAVPAVLDALRRGNPVRRWLLVFDAAESPEAVRKFFPTNGPGEILVTSRNPEWAGIARPLEVSVFRRDESKELLRRRGPDISEAEADQLADRLGDLPLAIEQAAAWRAETGMPVLEYLRLFDEKVAEILEASTSPDYEVSVAAAWNVSFDELRTRNPAAHQILHICAFFSPEPISRDLFTGVRGVSISPEMDVTLRDPIQLARAIRDINRYGLAKIDHGNNTIQLHRLVQLVLRNRLAAPQLQAQMRHGAHQLLANLDPNDPESGRNWPRYRELLPHAYAAEVVDCSDSWVRQLVINLMRFLFQWGDHDEAAALARRAFDDFTAKLGPNDPQTLEVAWRLGLYLWVLGRFEEAAELNQRTLERRIQTSGENSEETLGVQTNVLADLKAKGDFAGARRLSEDILVKTKKLFGEDDPETLQAAYFHAISLRLTGDFAAARLLDEDTSRRRIEVLGHDHPQTLNSLLAVVVDRREGGEYVWARVEHEKFVEQAADQFGEDRVVTQLRIYLLSIARRKEGDHSGALELSGPVLEHFRLRYGDKHPTTVGAALAHSIDLRHAGDLVAARRLGEEAFDSYRQMLGEQHPHTLAAKVDLAVTLRLSGDAAAARALDERALEHLRVNLGADHPNAIVSGINLASDLAALGETDAAIELGTEMQGRSRDALGAEHPTTLAAAVNLVFDLRAAGRDEDTDSRFAEAMMGYRRALGDRHPGTVAAAQGSRANCDIDPLIL